MYHGWTTLECSRLQKALAIHFHGFSICQDPLGLKVPTTSFNKPDWRLSGQIVTENKVKLVEWNIEIRLLTFGNSMSLLV